VTRLLLVAVLLLLIAWAFWKVVDGVIDIPRTRALMPDRPDEKFLRPEDIASSVFHLVQQRKSAWTFEIDLRPFTEQW